MDIICRDSEEPEVINKECPNKDNNHTATKKTRKVKDKILRNIRLGPNARYYRLTVCQQNYTIQMMVVVALQRTYKSWTYVLFVGSYSLLEYIYTHKWLKP